MPRKLVDLTGNMYGRLTVVDRVPGLHKGVVRWKCVCSCGNEHVAVGTDLKKGKINSCGCLRTELLKGKITHGHYANGKPSPTYSSWQAMHARCKDDNPDGPNYKYYFARGIQVHKPWYDFGTFLRDMGERPPGTSIDRINNDIGYKPTNCVWATPTEQQNNRRDNKCR